IRRHVSMVVGSGVRHFSFGLRPILHVASLRTTFLQIDVVCLLGHLIMRWPSFGFIFGCVFVFFHMGSPVICSMVLPSTLSDSPPRCFERGLTETSAGSGHRKSRTSVHQARLIGRPVFVPAD